MIHDLKIWTCFFDDVAEGRKTCELRRNDRPFRVGDYLVLREWDPMLSDANYTGRQVAVEVTHVLNPVEDACIADGMKVGFVVLSIRLIGAELPTRKQLAGLLAEVVRCQDALWDGKDAPCDGCQMQARHICANLLLGSLGRCRDAGLLSEEVAG